VGPEEQSNPGNTAVDVDAVAASSSDGEHWCNFINFYQHFHTLRKLFKGVVNNHDFDLCIDKNSSCFETDDGKSEASYFSDSGMASARGTDGTATDVQPGDENVQQPGDDDVVQPGRKRKGSDLTSPAGSKSKTFEAIGLVSNLY
jgi:hypothetical protein